MEQPAVSVLVPMHNAESYIAETLKHLLAEREVIIEVIVIDDNSTDFSASVVSTISDPRIRLVRSSGKGISDTLNTGIALSRGAIVMRCDADDLYPPDRIRSQVDWLEKNGEFDAVCGSFSTIDKRGNLVGEMSCGRSMTEITDELLSGNARTHLCTFAIRSNAIARTSGFRRFFETAEDLDFQFRLAVHSRVAYLPQSWYLYRIHDTSVTHTQADNRRQYFENLAKQLAVERLAQGTDRLELGKTPAPPIWSSSQAPLSSQKHIQGLLLGRAWGEFHQGLVSKSLLTSAKAVLADVTSISTWRSAITLLLKAIFSVPVR